MWLYWRDYSWILRSMVTPMSSKSLINIVVCESFGIGSLKAGPLQHRPGRCSVCGSRISGVATWTIVLSKTYLLGRQLEDGS